MMLPKYYQDPAIFHVGTEKPRAYYVPFSSADAATTALKNGTSRRDSDRLQMLCGDWSFRYYQSVADVELPFWDAPFENTIPVPAMWQLHGYDVPQYVNMDYPFPFDPPYVPLENPCGAYHTQFTVDAAHRDERCYLNFEGVDSCYYVWVNGTFVGYSQVSHATAEWDITDHVTVGDNTLSVLVLKWCDGSYLEDQDKFRMSGIFRDVYLLYRPAEHLRDFTIRTPLDNGAAITVA